MDCLEHKMWTEIKPRVRELAIKRIIKQIEFNLLPFAGKMNTILAVYFLVLLGIVTAIDVNNCDRIAKRGDGITCYKVLMFEGTFLDARSQCQGSGMDLLSITSEDENNAVIGLMRDRSIGEIWINLNVTNSTWRWPDGSELFEQGCYPGQSLMNFIGDKITDNSFLTCSEECKDSKYVGLMNGYECFCGNRFGGRPGAQCQTPCPSATTENCGGTDSQRIVAKNGEYSNWLSDQPNDGGKEGGPQMCSIIEDNLKWNDISCQSSYYAICEISLSPELFPTCDTSVAGVHAINTSGSGSDSCVYVTDHRLGYFEAVSECSRFNGQLLRIPNKEFNDYLGEVLPKKFPFWIGATRFKQVWLSGEPVVYTDWPKNTDVRAGYGFIKRTDISTISESWTTADGSQKKFIMCQTTNATYISKASYFSVTTTTTSTLLTKLINSPVGFTTLTLPPPLNYTPPTPINNVSTIGNKLSSEATAGIIGGAVGGGLLLIIITIVLIIVICKRKRESPSKKSLDEESSVQPTYFFDLTSDTMDSKNSISKSIADTVSIESATPPPPPYYSNANPDTF